VPRITRNAIVVNLRHAVIVTYERSWKKIYLRRKRARYSRRTK